MNFDTESACVCFKKTLFYSFSLASLLFSLSCSRGGSKDRKPPVDSNPSLEQKDDFNLSRWDRLDLRDPGDFLADNWRYGDPIEPYVYKYVRKYCRLFVTASFRKFHGVQAEIQILALKERFWSRLFIERGDSDGKSFSCAFQTRVNEKKSIIYHGSVNIFLFTRRVSATRHKDGEYPLMLGFFVDPVLNEYYLVAKNMVLVEDDAHGNNSP